MSTNKQIHLQTIIPEELDGKRLDAALAQLFPEYSRAQIQSWIKEGSVSINKTITVKQRAAVRADQNINIDATIHEQGNWEAQNIPINIVYEDNDLMVINKPVGLVVHPGAGNPDHTLINALLHHEPALATIPRAGIIHRLDKDTSGLLVIAKTLPTHTALVQMMQSREISREYRALVFGELISGGTVNAAIGRHPTQRIKMAVVKNGKPAVTHYRVLKKSSKYTLLAVNLETGRTHQIRVHMAHIGHPIVGDQVYAKRFNAHKEIKLTHQALHAYRLSLIHPINHEKYEWEAPIPDSMLDAIDIALPKK